MEFVWEELIRGLDDSHYDATDAWSQAYRLVEALTKKASPREDHDEVVQRVCLKLLKYEFRHDELGIDNPSITDIGNSAVDNHTGIENERPIALYLLGELDVGNDETKFVFRLKQGRDGNVTADDGDQEAK